MHLENKTLCKRLVDVHKRGCTFDCGRDTPLVRPLPKTSVARINELEIIARQNEKLFKRIINKKSHYQREEQLRDYDKILPKLLSYSKYPEAMIKNLGIKFL
ncbi:hypothetical protein EGW08_010578 [Elysia chlorotica]|uniref:Uncharacterized protein n=1 Tax=Elysia chlorotica TaxID=188477 RepID=A0A3S0ZN47_ELYCH|nr:hypothetical protein EGW08_010578 [Elysia chlorotica]